MNALNLHSERFNSGAVMVAPSTYAVPTVGTLPLAVDADEERAPLPAPRHVAAYPAAQEQIDESRDTRSRVFAKVRQTLGSIEEENAEWFAEFDAAGGDFARIEDLERLLEAAPNDRVACLITGIMMVRNWAPGTKT